MATEWLTTYEAELCRACTDATRLRAFALARGGQVTFTQARAAIQSQARQGKAVTPAPDGYWSGVVENGNAAKSDGVPSPVPVAQVPASDYQSGERAEAAKRDEQKSLTQALAHIDEKSLTQVLADGNDDRNYDTATGTSLEIAIVNAGGEEIGKLCVAGHTIVAKMRTVCLACWVSRMFSFFPPLVHHFCETAGWKNTICLMVRCSLPPRCFRRSDCLLPMGPLQPCRALAPSSLGEAPSMVVTPEL